MFTQARHKTRIPRKKHKVKGLTKEVIKFIKMLNKERVIVETTIGRMKKFRTFDEEFKNGLKIRYQNIVMNK